MLDIMFATIDIALRVTLLGVILAAVVMIPVMIYSTVKEYGTVNNRKEFYDYEKDGV